MKFGNMDVLGRARRLESRIARRLDSAAQDFMGSGAREPLEIVHSIVEAVEREIQPGGRGRRTFPFNRITLSVLAHSRDSRARFEAVFAGEPPLRERIVDRLRPTGCMTTAPLPGPASFETEGPWPFQPRPTGFAFSRATRLCSARRACQSDSPKRPAASVALPSKQTAELRRNWHPLCCSALVRK